MASLELRVRDIIGKILPPWLSARVQRGKTAGFRFVWGLVAAVDVMLDAANQGIAAWFPGVGTPTALPYIGRSRGIIRGQGESHADYAARLTRWLETWTEAGSQELIAVSIHEFLSTRPRVRVVNRAGQWVTVEADGTIVRHQSPWDWDSISHPERNDPDEPWWSDLWVIIQSPWEERPGTLGEVTGDDGFAFGHLATHEEVDAVTGLFAQWKGAHSCIRAAIWTTDSSLFDPTDSDTCPNGRWGAWGIFDGTSFVPSDRNITTCRYWEPR